MNKSLIPMNVYLTYQQIIRMLQKPNPIKSIYPKLWFDFFLFSEKRRTKIHGRLYRFFNRKANYLRHANNLSRFVDYTLITCRFSIPIRLPDVICVNVIIYNRDNNNSITATSIKNVPLEQILELIEYNKKFYKEPMLPVYSTNTSFPTTNDHLVMVNNNEDESFSHNSVGPDEKLL
jgi:hypothetical protein